MTIEPFEIYAIRYAHLGSRHAGENFVLADPHEYASDLDYFVWVLRRSDGDFMVDTGFDEEAALRRGRELLRSPAEALLRAGIDPAEVPDVVLTHMHWDHAGGMEYFPKATFHLQAAEMAYCTGPCMCQPFLRRPFDVDDVQSAVRALYADRLRFHDGTAEIALGVTLHLIGGHSGGIQSVRVPTERGWVVLAGDATHLWGNIRKRMPFPVVVDVARMLKGFEILESLADGPDHIIPGHDPLILKRFPPVAGYPDTVRLDLPPIA